MFIFDKKILEIANYKIDLNPGSKFQFSKKKIFCTFLSIKRSFQKISPTKFPTKIGLSPGDPLEYFWMISKVLRIQLFNIKFIPRCRKPLKFSKNKNGALKLTRIFKYKEWRRKIYYLLKTATFSLKRWLYAYSIFDFFITVTLNQKR